MYTSISYDVVLTSECPQHSELNGGLIVSNGIKISLYKSQSVCQSNISKLCFKLVVAIVNLFTVNLFTAVSEQVKHPNIF